MKRIVWRRLLFGVAMLPLGAMMLSAGWPLGVAFPVAALVVLAPVASIRLGAIVAASGCAMLAGLAVLVLLST